MKKYEMNMFTKLCSIKADVGTGRDDDDILQWFLFWTSGDYHSALKLCNMKSLCIIQHAMSAAQYYVQDFIGIMH